jgi:hypothetical protein
MSITVMSMTDHVEHVGNALAVDGTDTPGQRRLVIERPPHGLVSYEVDARLRALVAHVGHGGLCSELRDGGVFEDAARLG